MPTQILGAVAADLLHKSVPGLCLIISRTARYLPKLALNNILSLLCILRSLWCYPTTEVGRYDDYSAHNPTRHRNEQKHPQLEKRAKGLKKKMSFRLKNDRKDARLQD